MLPPCGHFWNSNGKSCADGTSFSSGLRGSKEESLATSWEELTHWKRLWCWEGLGAKGEGDDRGWDGWMASLTRWTWAWVNFGSWWWTGRPGVLRFLGSQRVGHDWTTELNWTCSWVSSLKVSRICFLVIVVGDCPQYGFLRVSYKVPLAILDVSLT